MRPAEQPGPYGPGHLPARWPAGRKLLWWADGPKRLAAGWAAPGWRAVVDSGPESSWRSCLQRGSRQGAQRQEVPAAQGDPRPPIHPSSPHCGAGCVWAKSEIQVPPRSGLSEATWGEWTLAGQREEGQTGGDERAKGSEFSATRLKVTLATSGIGSWVLNTVSLSVDSRDTGSSPQRSPWVH